MHIAAQTHLYCLTQSVCFLLVLPVSVRFGLVVSFVYKHQEHAVRRKMFSLFSLLSLISWIKCHEKWLIVAETHQLFSSNLLPMLTAACVRYWLNLMSWLGTFSNLKLPFGYLFNIKKQVKKIRLNFILHLTMENTGHTQCHVLANKVSAQICVYVGLHVVLEWRLSCRERQSQVSSSH